MAADRADGGTAAVFLDRDGTVIEEVGYLDRLDRVRLFPWSIEAVRLLGQAGYLVLVVTNQAGVARGYFDETFVRSVHEHLDSRFAEGGASIAGWYYCPHHVQGTVEEYRVDCGCRKPKPGMLRRAAGEHAIDLRRSYVVGDRWLDVALAASVEARGILVRTGHGATEEASPVADVRADAIVPTLMDAASWILRNDA